VFAVRVCIPAIAKQPRRRPPEPPTFLLADETGFDHLVTLDERGFRTYRFRSTRRFQLVLAST